MTYEPPGLDHDPGNARLSGFASLMPPQPKQRGCVAKLLLLPLALLALPFRALRAILTAAGRVLGGRGDS